MGHWNEDAGAEVFEHPCFVYGKVKIQTTSRVQEVCQNVENTAFPSSFSFFSFFKGINFFFKILFIFRQRGREGEREGEKHQCVVASPMPLHCGPGPQPGTCPVWDANQQPFGSQAIAQSTEPHQPGPKFFFYGILSIMAILSAFAKYDLKILTNQCESQV